MQIYKRSVYAAVLQCLFTLFSLHSVNAQSSSDAPAMPAMPSLPAVSDAPSMPSISAPTIGSPFYRPGNNAYSQKKSASNSRTAQSSAQKNTAATQSETQKTDLLSALLSSESSSDLESSRLTASDVTLLGQNGLLNGIYGLAGNASSYNSSSNTDILLTKILEQLNELKKEQDEKLQSDETDKSGKNTASQNAALPYIQPDKSQRPAILRFVINGYNILDTCRTVYFSKQEQDGSFLLTADRRYISDNTVREETFYLLFKADGNCGASKGYDVQPAVVQDYQNDYSLVYQLAQKKNLKASKAGNLVSLRSTAPDWNLDLLLDIGE